VLPGTPGPGLWSRAASLIAGRERHTATLLPDGRVLVAGGTNGLDVPLASAEIYNPKTDRWTSVGSMSTSRLDQTATLLSDGRVLVAGGLAEPTPSTLASAELYDPTTNTWSAAAPMSGGRARHTATRLRDGRVLVVGGISTVLRGNGIFTNQVADAEIYDPVANRWSVTGPMATYRLDQTATILTDGRVLIAGGQDGLTSTEIYDATKDRWDAGASMGQGRLGQAATLLANGDVLVAGGGVGSDANALSAVERYDPRRNSWAPRTSMAQGRVGHTATLLRNGKVLVVGSTNKTRSVLYDPARNDWSDTGPLMVRYNQTATRLPDGRVLIAGGYGIDSLASVLLYDPTRVAPTPPKPLDQRLLAALLLGGVIVGAGIAWSIPGVRLRVRRLRPSPGADEWIS